MATTNGYDTSVRQALRGKGVLDSDIGYNKGTGYVTVKGQNFMKPDKVYEGTSFTNQNNFNSAWDAYNKAQTAAATSQYNPSAAAYTPSQAPNTTPYGYSNPYDQQYTDQFASLRGLMNQAPVSVQDIYNSPAYAARQAQADRAAQQGIRAAQEAYGASGFGRSTALGERSQNIANEANEYLELQVLPQLMAAEENRRQQQLQNSFSLLNALASQQGVYDTRMNNANDRNFREWELTGSGMPLEARNLLDQLIGLKQQAETRGISADQRAGLSSQADAIRAQLGQYGVDPSLFGANVNSAAAARNIGQVARPTLAAQGQQFNQDLAKQQFDRGVLESDRAFNYAQDRDKIEDERWEREFDEDRRRFGMNYALEQLQLKQSAANAAASRSQSAENARIATLFDIWDRTGVAPEGIPGIKAGTMLSSGQGGMTPQDMQKESSAMIGALRSGQITPDQALRQIQDDETLGIYSPENANYLRSQVERISREVPRTEAPQEVITQAQATMPSDKEIEAEARTKGYPIMDYKQWYKARDGRLAGLSYPDWARLYGPTIGPRQ